MQTDAEGEVLHNMRRPESNQPRPSSSLPCVTRVIQARLTPHPHPQVQDVYFTFAWGTVADAHAMYDRLGLPFRLDERNRTKIVRASGLTYRLADSRPRFVARTDGDE